MFARTFKQLVNLKCLNGLHQGIEKGCLVQKRYKDIIPTKQSPESSEIPNSREFHYNFISQARNAASKEENQELMSMWPEVIESIAKVFADIPQYKEHFTTLMQENVYNHKQASGVLVVTAYKAFEAPEKLRAETIKLANVLGCCVNMLHAMFIILDDIVDSAEMRFGKPSWYTRKDVGMTAVADAIILENGIYLVLRKYLSGIPCHFPAVEYFHDVNMKTAIGFSLDTKTYEITANPSLELFTMDTYKLIANYKGSYPIYILPITLGMFLAGKYDSEMHRLTRAVLYELGLHAIVQNDILDCYGNPAITGKNSTDIRLGKHTWLVVKALEHATSVQKQILNDHYGRPEGESELKVRTLYNDLDMLNEYLLFEEQSFNKVCQGIQQIPKDINKEFLLKMVEAEYNRKIKLT